MKERASAQTLLLPLGVFAVLLVAWSVVSALGIYPKSAFPPPQAVLEGFAHEVRSGRMLTDVAASLWRVAIGFGVAVALSVPVGLWMGHSRLARLALLPAVNFFRNLSPLAWITFAVLWFKIGDAPAIFLIFMGTFFTLVLSISAAVANIPAVQFRVARDYGYKGLELITKVSLPAIMPQFITALRVAAGVSWMVVVAAEMIAGINGLGFAVWDDRNALRTDWLVCHMVVIGVIGMGLDWLLARLTLLPEVRWGYEQ
ncbi:MAG: ABC transporter permease [Armatimonadota bacterium]